MSTAAKLQVTNVPEGRANSQTGMCEIDIVHSDGTSILQMDQEMLLRLTAMVLRLQSIPPPEADTPLSLRPFPVDWWTLGPTPDRRELVMSFEIQGGGHIALRLDLENGARIADMLRQILGGVASMPPRFTN
ncbi:MAG TPA: hypothetical protein VG407_01355 [Caulobacteraceae bacterium]|jgi:hypothetical protein|nr:hypothetical protein [Caulobacteraceae bacterium]